MDKDGKSLFSELTVQDVADMLYNILNSIRNTLTLPTHKTLFTSLKISGLLTASSIISYATGFYTFINPIGALLCFGFLLTLSIMEGSENNELSRMYSAAKLSAGEIARRAKTAGTRLKTRRNTDDRNRSEQEVGE